MNWRECKFKKFVKEKRVEEDLIRFLLEESVRKLKSNDLLELDDTTATTKICIIYDSLREVLEALALKKGFKIYNHECFTAFLREVCLKENFSKSFDIFRKIRNGINYYGKRLSKEDARILILKITTLRKEILEEFL